MLPPLEEHHLYPVTAKTNPGQAQIVPKTNRPAAGVLGHLRSGHRPHPGGSVMTKTWLEKCLFDKLTARIKHTCKSENKQKE